MFTQCPDCHTTFRVTAAVLQQAEGRVRCGGCGNAFNALDHLSEADGSKSSPNTHTSTGSTTDQNKKLLETLEKLAGPDVTLEDTGVEWRILKEGDAAEGGEEASEAPAMLGREEDVPRPVSDAQATLDLPGTESIHTDPAERRYDDNTILPENFGSEDDLDELPFLSKPETPKRRAGDREAVLDATEFDEAQVDLALGEPDEWVDLLDEVDDEEEAEETAEAAAGEEPSTDEDRQAVGDEPPEEDMPSDIDTQFLLQAEEMGIDTGSHQIIDEEAVENIDDYLASAATEAETDTDTEDDDLDATDIGEIETEDKEALEAAAAESEDETAVAETEEESEVELSLDKEDEPSADSQEDESAADSEVEEKEEAKPTEEPEDSGEIEAQAEVAEKALAGKDEEEQEERAEEAVELELEEDGENIAAKAEAESEDDTSATIIGGKDVSKLFAEGSQMVETIVMEGDMIGDSINEKRPKADVAASPFENPGPLEDTYSLSRGRIKGGRRASDPAGSTVMIAIGVLALILLIQVMHQSRRTLATYGAFNQTIGSIYRVLGKPVTPEWDVRGWQFESTSNSVDEEQDLLTIYSRIANKSGQDLPYPLVHISLTDRWEDIIGSRVLEPGDYLAGDLDPRTPVPSGEDFNAVITIESPSAEATGFKLTVCYRVMQGRVRCATQDFKN
jgi:predicted Zn finger-like uncharacterized protein